VNAPHPKSHSWSPGRLASLLAALAIVVGICPDRALAGPASDAPDTFAEMARFLAMDAAVELRWDSLPASRISVEILTPRGVEVRRVQVDNATGVVVATTGLVPGVYLARAMRDGVVQQWGFFRK